MIKISAESEAFFGVNDPIEVIEEGLKKAKGYGIEALDYNFAPRDNHFYKLDDEEFKKQLTELKDLAGKYGIVFNQVHSVWPHDCAYDFDTNFEERKRDFPTYVKSLKGASYLGAKYVVVHTAMPYGWARDLHEELVIEINEVFIKDLLPYAKEYGVVICLENLPFRTQLASTKRLNEFVKKFNDPNLMVCFDTGHAFVLKEDLAEDVLMLGSNLACMHVHDNKGADYHLIPYQGGIKWEGFLDALKKINYKGTFSLETHFTKNMPEPFRDEFNRLLFKLARSMADKIEN